MEERLKHQIDFILEADKLKNIVRQTYISDGSRKENDSEHSWHMALMSILLCEYANEKVDVLKVMIMVLIHDIVEIDAGDTYAYDTIANEFKAEKEYTAAMRIFNILPKDQAEYMISLWEEFEKGDTPEARFAAVLDRIQPLLLNDTTDGISWKEHGVCKEQVMKRNEKTGLGSETLWKYAKELIERNVLKGNLERNNY